MIKGLRTVIYPVSDLQKAKDWYAKVVGRAPYFDTRYYVGFSVGGFELGLIPDGYSSPDGVQAYWGVSDMLEDLNRLKELGAVVVEPAKDVGGGVTVAALKDPFGNVFRIIENPNFDPTKME